MTLRSRSAPLLLWSIAVIASPAIAESVPTRGNTDSRIRTAIYRSDEVYRLTGRIGYQIDIEFAADERYAGLASGDGDGLSFESQANHLFIKPRAARVATNLTILTDRRRYYVDYAVAPVPAPPTQPATKERQVGRNVGTDDGVIFALRFLYPEEEAERAARTEADRREREQLRSALDIAHEPKNLDYWYCGAPTIRPVEVSDNGVQTRFRFAARSELPAVFVRNDDRSESLVNVSVQGDSLLVHRIARQFILRRGRLVGCVVNKSFEGSGDRPQSGTISPEIERLSPVVDP